MNAGTKRCSRCGREKRLDEFHRAHTARVWHKRKAYCKTCARIHWNEWAKTPAGKATRARSTSSESQKRRCRAWRARHPAKARAIGQAWRAANRVRQKALTAIHNAVRGGRIVRPKTCACGRGGRMEADFSDPVHPFADLRFVCSKCKHALRRRKGGAQELEATPADDLRAIARAALAVHDRLSTRSTWIKGGAAARAEMSSQKHLDRLLAALRPPEWHRVPEAPAETPDAFQGRFRPAYEKARRPTYAEQCLEDALGIGQGTWRPDDHPAAE